MKQKSKDITFFLLKCALIAFLVWYVWFVFQNKVTKEVSVQEIEETLQNRETVSALLRCGDKDVKRELELEPSEYPDSFCYQGESFLDVSLLFVAKVDDVRQFEQLEQKLEAYTEKEKDRFNNYGTNQMDILEHAIRVERGNYFFYAISEHAQEWEEVFLSCIQGR